MVLIHVASSDGIEETKHKEITKTCNNGTELCETGTGSSSDKSSINDSAIPTSTDSKQPSIVIIYLIYAV